jgi:pimeloyl-ACP methyl ester carboxylesterase
MRRLGFLSVRFVLGLCVVLIIASCSASRVHAAGPSIIALRASGAAQVQDVYVRVPQGVANGQPLQVVVALHGMGGNGPDFAAGLAEQADRYGWLLVAPTIKYGDWTDPLKIAHEDPALAAWLSDEVRTLAVQADQPLQPRVLVFGHSRGAQLALRFTEIHPEQVAAVAAVSAGTYTLPAARDAATGQPLNFPFGVANLAVSDGGTAFDARLFKGVPIWIGVGALDDNPADVPHQWDPYIGDDRRERAERFAEMLQTEGGNVTLQVFDGVSHGLTDDVRTAGCAALANAAS